MFASIAERLRASTVQVRVGGSGGSGVIWDHEGIIVTNAHVAYRSYAQVELADGRLFQAHVYARDPERDLAVLTVDAAGLPSAPIGDPRRLRVGELVVAMGFPLGLPGALTAGIIHRVGQRWVCADLRLAPGNSGGPLADAMGRVVGVNSLVSYGLAFAVPSTVVWAMLRRLGELAVA